MIKLTMTDAEWDRDMRERFPNGPFIPQAIEFARERPHLDEEVLAKVVQTKFPQVNGEYLVKSVRGYRLVWTEGKKGDVPRWVAPLPVRKRVKV